MNAVQLRYIELYIFFKKKLYYKDQNKRKKKHVHPHVVLGNWVFRRYDQLNNFHTFHLNFSGNWWKKGGGGGYLKEILGKYLPLIEKFLLKSYSLDIILNIYFVYRVNVETTAVLANSGKMYPGILLITLSMICLFTCKIYCLVSIITIVLRIRSYMINLVIICESSILIQPHLPL